MTQQDYVNLIRRGVTKKTGIWADFGSGEGTFTLALSELLVPTAEMYSIDKHMKSLTVQRREMASRFPKRRVEYIQADFTQHLNLPPLDGAIAANSIHFVRDRVAVLKVLKNYLKPDGKLIIVEYNTDEGNLWVPHPFSIDTLPQLTKDAGFSDVEFLETVPSQFLKEMYSAALIV